MSRNSSWDLAATLGWLLGCLLIAIALLFGENERPTAVCGACGETIQLKDHSFNWPRKCPFCGEPVTLTGVFQ